MDTAFMLWIRINEHSAFTRESMMALRRCLLDAVAQVERSHMPQKLRVGEIRVAYRSLNDEQRAIVRRALDECDEELAQSARRKQHNEEERNGTAYA